VPGLFALAARTAAHRAFTAFLIAARPAALSLRFAFAGSAFAALTAAHRFRCALAIRRLPAAVMPPRFLAVGPVPFAATGLLDNWARSSAILESIFDSSA
jgi:hypothetical protein